MNAAELHPEAKRLVDDYVAGRFDVGELELKLDLLVRPIAIVQAVQMGLLSPDEARRLAFEQMDAQHRPFIRPLWLGDDPRVMIAGQLI